MAAAFAIPRIESAPASPRIATAETREQLEFAGVFRGRELTRKDRRLPSGLPLVDSLLDGGIVRGRVSEIIGDRSSGKTTLAASFAAFSTMRGEFAAWVDSADSFDRRGREFFDFRGEFRVRSRAGFPFEREFFRRRIVFLGLPSAGAFFGTECRSREVGRGLRRRSRCTKLPDRQS